MSTMKRRAMTKEERELKGQEVWLPACEDVNVGSYVWRKVAARCRACGVCDGKPKKALVVVL